MRYHMANLAISSYIDCKYGLEQPRGGADFWLAFSGADFEEGSSQGGTTAWSPGHGMGPQPGDLSMEWDQKLSTETCDMIERFTTETFDTPKFTGIPEIL